MRKILLILTLSSLTFNGWAFRCNQSLIYQGDSQYTVQKKCGQPDSKEVATITQPLVNEEGYVYGSAPLLQETWIYDRSPNDFIYQVFFKDGVVVSIEANRFQQ